MIHKIKALHNEGAGLSIRSIACQLGISRNTVRKYLRMDEAAIGEQQSNRTRHKQLDDYRDYIVTLLGKFPHLSAVKVLRKLKERHPELGVSDRSARRYIKALKETVSLRQKRYYEPVKRVFDLVKDFGTSESPKSTRSSTTHWCPGRPGHPAFRHNIASSLRLHTGLPYDWTPRSDAPLGSPLAPSARRVSRVASRLPGTTRLRFALHGGQRQFPVLLSAHLVDRLAKIFGHMELVEGDLALGPGNHLQRGVDESWPHVHRDALNGLQAGSGQRFEPLL